MAQTFYDNSVASYLQILSGLQQVLERGLTFSEENDLDLDELMGFRLRDDMAPFAFQVISAWHHSMGAVKGMESGVFGIPPKIDDMTYGKAREMVDEAIAYLQSKDRDAINALSGKDMVFRIGDRDIPFTTDNFLASFSLPNFYFHTTTTYAILRMHGVPLGKMDYLGQMRVGPAA